MSRANPIKSVTCKFVGHRNKEEEKRYRDGCNLIYQLLQRELQKTARREMSEASAVNLRQNL